MRRLLTASALLLALASAEMQPLPLSVNDVRIVDAKNASVALVGVNWAGHERTMLPEGLQHQSIPNIVTKIVETGFNSVRLTFATEMVDDIVAGGGDKTLKDTLQNALGPDNGTAVMKQIMQKNPAFNESSKRLDVWNAVAAELAGRNIYLHLDNHVSKAGWCCSPYDGNGWFGDANFNTSNWVRGLSFMAEHGKANWKSFSSMGLRNELRDPFSAPPAATLENTTWTTWKTRMIQGANAIHNANPDVLIFFGGRIFDFDISAPVQGKFASEPDFNFSIAELPFKNKFVFEQHQYDQGLVGNNCTAYADILTAFGSNTVSDGANRAPLVMSEWGHDQRDESGTFNGKFRKCLMQFMIEKKIQWMVWVLGGSYYTREGVQDKDEPWALLDHTWSTYRGRESIRQLQTDMRNTYKAFNMTMPAGTKDAGRDSAGGGGIGGNKGSGASGGFSRGMSLAAMVSFVVTAVVMMV